MGPCRTLVLYEGHEAVSVDLIDRRANPEISLQRSDIGVICANRMGREGFRDEKPADVLRTSVADLLGSPVILSATTGSEPPATTRWQGRGGDLLQPPPTLVVW